MTPNENTVDRVIRGGIAVTALGAGTALGGVFTPPGIALFTIAGVAGATAVTGYCPLYSLLGISTRATAEQ
jgi:hypothetical protein